MKKLYVLTHGDYDDEIIVGVFDSLVEVDKGEMAFIDSEYHCNPAGEEAFHIYAIEGMNFVGEIYCL